MLPSLSSVSPDLCEVSIPATCRQNAYSRAASLDIIIVTNFLLETGVPSELRQRRKLLVGKHLRTGGISS
jgi:hypothetical protein